MTPRPSLRFAATAVALTALVACSPPKDVLATWRGGEIRVADLDAFVLGVGQTQPPADADRVAWLREQLHDLFARRVLVTPEALAEVEEDPDFQDAWELQRRQILRRERMRRHNARFDVTLDDVRAELEARRERLDQPERRVFHHLFRAYPPEAGAAAREAVCAETAALRERVLGGASFEGLVREHSQSANAALGGEVGPVARSALRGEVAATVFALAPGEVSPVVATAAGCQIFLVRQVLPATRPTLEQIQERLAVELAERRRLAWRQELVAEAARELGAELPPWLLSAGPLPQLAADEVVFTFGDERVLARDVAARAAPGTPPRVAVLTLVEEILLAAALERELSPAELDALLAAPRAEAAAAAVRRRRLLERQQALPEEPLRRHYEANLESYRSEPQLELTLWSWPLSGGDPVAAAARPARFAATLAGGADPAAAWLAYAGDRGAIREPVSQAGLRHLAASRPALSPLLARAQLAEGDVVGPFRAGDRLFVARVDVLVPSRPRSFLEVRAEVLADYVRDHADELRQAWLEELADSHRLRVYDEHLASFGANLVDRLQAPPAGG